MKRNYIAVAIALIVGAASGAFLSSAGAQVGQGLPPAPTIGTTIIPVGVSGAGNFAWFLSNRTVWSCTAGAGSAAPPVCTKGTLP